MKAKDIMKKQLVIIGIVAILVGVGLSGCNGNGIGYTSMGDIRNHPNRYINQTVTVLGKYLTTYMTYIYDTSGGKLYISIPSNVKQPTPFIAGLEYKFTGRVRYGILNYITCTYLEVTRIETT